MAPRAQLQGPGALTASRVALLVAGLVVCGLVLSMRRATTDVFHVGDPLRPPSSNAANDDPALSTGPPMTQGPPSAGDNRLPSRARSEETVAQRERGVHGSTRDARKYLVTRALRACPSYSYTVKSRNVYAVCNALKRQRLTRPRV